MYFCLIKIKNNALLPILIFLFLSLFLNEFIAVILVNELHFTFLYL